MTRRDVLTWLLENYHDLRDAGAAEPGGGGDRVPLTAHDRGCRLFQGGRCSCWRRSVAELDRALALLKADAPVGYAHLNGRYRSVVIARRQMRFRNGTWVKASNEKIIKCASFDPSTLSRQPPRNGLYDTLVVTWPLWVDLLIVAQGLDGLEERYRGEPYLPREAIAA